MTNMKIRSLSAEFLATAARRGTLGKIRTSSDVVRMFTLTEQVRQRILIPGVEKVAQGLIVLERKETGGGRTADAKTLTVATDHEAESFLIYLQRQKFPGALIIGEEMFGALPDAEKTAALQCVLTHDNLCILNDALDGTRPFTQGKDGFGTMVSLVRSGRVVGSVVHLAIQHHRIDHVGYTLSWEKGDSVRIDGAPLRRLDHRQFPADPKKLRGYATYEFHCDSDRLAEVFEGASAPRLKERFDGISDIWTCGTLYRDMLRGEHHFMLVAPPVDVFDYPMGVAMLQAAGGVARFIDGTDASLAEIIRRQGYGKPEGRGYADPQHFRALEQSLILAVSEGVYETVRRVLSDEILSRRRPSVLTAPGIV